MAAPDDDEPRSKKNDKHGASSEKPRAGGKRRRDDDEKEDERPIAKKSNTLWHVLVGLGLAAVFGCCCLPGGVGGYWWYNAHAIAEDRQKKVESEPGLEVTAEEITLAYKENVAAADLKFKDKVLVVKGNVMAVPDAESVRLWPGMRHGTIEIFFRGAHCAFSEKNKGQVLTMKKGDIVRIKGYCTGGATSFAETSLVQCKKVD